MCSICKNLNAFFLKHNKSIKTQTQSNGPLQGNGMAAISKSLARKQNAWIKTV